ncbi:unnamed protein product [Caenorhabditis nigoni]
MTSRLALFDQTLSASLLQRVNSDPHDYKAYKTRVKLKILEQRGEHGEKELKFEISRADDFEFLFAAILNNEKYQELAKAHELTVDFDTFPKVIIQHLLCKNIVKTAEEDGIEVDAKGKPGYHSIIENGRVPPTEINIKLEKDKNSCEFEIFSKTPISKGKIFAMSLQAVRGDLLIAHLLKICSSQSTKLATLHRSTDELAALKTKISEMEKRNQSIEDLEKKIEEQEERIREIEDELELVKEERENIRVIAEEKEDLVAELQNDLESVNRELEENQEELEIVGKMLGEEQGKVDQLQKRNVAHQKELATLQRNFQKVESQLKRSSVEQSQQSLDIRKLRELEADLKEKDSMVENLTQTVGILKKELEDERVKMQETLTSFESLKVENESVKERLAMYRNQRFSPAPVGLQTTTIPGAGVGFKTVLGQNSPYANNPNMRTPFRDTSSASNTGLTYQNSITPLPNTTRFLMADDTTGSSVTNTPPVLRNPL